ncbi:hypothetical protein [Spongiimicrobium sp. 3-5]|uniref:hypothetical protein n=1 Tax=Spongiimicrobium sp. 3-5 TaxID=3332596 RepID=UPI0039816713
METTIQIFLTFLTVYAILGVLFGIYFFFKGASQLDSLITESKWTVRLLLIPGAIALWPVLLSRLVSKLKTKS